MHFVPGTPFVLGGTKLDLLEDEAALERLKAQGITPVTTEQAIAVAKEVGAAAYIPYSSRTQKVSHYIPILTILTLLRRTSKRQSTPS